MPDTRYVQDLLPEFKAQTGIDVEIESISYIDMHSKLVPQLSSPEGGYDAIVVDFYWVAEFTQAGWLMPLDDLIKKDNVDTSVYVPSLMNLVGKVNDVTYMLPFYNYSMGIIYRKDMLNDPKEQAAFKAKYGTDLKIPTTWDEYKKQVEFFTRDTDGDGKADFYGTVNQGQRGDCISMQWSNYLYANGGQYHDANWKATFNGEAGVKAVEDFKNDIAKHGPTGAESFCFDEASNGLWPGQGLQLRDLQYPALRIRRSELLAGRRQGRNCANPERRPQWRLGMGHSRIRARTRKRPGPSSSGSSRRTAVKKRTLAGGAPTQAWAFDDPEIVAKRPEMGKLKILVATAQEFPTFTYTVDFVESPGP